ncbi:MAG: hypothetical protein JWL62_1955 [Hyphomicrobiales bacterium]|nr:hypothetical protein [Hyphomicrobiales bacterium]
MNRENATSEIAPKLVRALGVLVLFSLSLAGCGRRGDLEAPPGSTPAPAKAAAEQQSGVDTRIDATDPMAPRTRGNVVPPRKPFILDSIL